MKVKDVMTSPVVSIEPDAPVLQAVQIMLQRHISGLPVVDKEGRLVGIVTEGDFLRRAETGTERRRPRWLEYLIGPGRLADEYTRSHGRRVSEIMTADPLTVSEETSLDEVVRVMEKRQIKRLPVVRGNEVVGIVSRANLVHALAGLVREIKPTAASDQAIHDRIVTELAGQSWAPAALHQCHRQGWRGRALGHDHRRARAPGDYRGRRERARREDGNGPSGLGRRAVRHGTMRFE